MELKFGGMPAIFRGYPPGITTMGTESPKAWATPPNEFSVPGPCCMQNTPIFRPEVMRLTASAMCSPVRSWRTMMGRMPATAAASRM